MRLYALCKRNVKEMLRDVLNVIFFFIFPIIILVLLFSINSNIPALKNDPHNFFNINLLAPAICVFSFSFVTLFSATLISKDRESAFLQRLYTTPISPIHYILSYTLPIIPLGLIQCLVCYVVSLILGLDFTVNILYSILFLLPVCVLFISQGLLFGCILNVKQVGGVCGALLTNIVALCSGIMFDLNLIGSGFSKAMHFLPYANAVDLARNALLGDFSACLVPFIWVIGYTVVIFAIAVVLFLKQMKK